MKNLLVLDRGSLGPSTVTLIALAYVATCGGEVFIIMVRVKLLPKNFNKKKTVFILTEIFYC